MVSHEGQAYASSLSSANTETRQKIYKFGGDGATIKWTFLNVETDT